MENFYHSTEHGHHEDRNSFIANINLLVRKLQLLIDINEKFNLSKEQIDALIGLTKLDLQKIIDDLNKGTVNGSRKLDIEILKNITGYDPLKTATQLLELYTKSTVKYNSATFRFMDGEDITITFSKSISTGTDLCYEIQNAIKYTGNIRLHEKIENTIITCVNDPIIGDVFVRIMDVNDITPSNVKYVTLNVVSGTYINSRPIYPWNDTTSSLETVSANITHLLDLLNKYPDFLKYGEYLELVAGAIEAAMKNLELITISNNLLDVRMSNELPKDLGTTYAGISKQISRADHVHKLPDIPGLSSSGTLPLSDSPTSASAGTSSYSSRADHVHKMIQGTNATKTADGSLGESVSAKFEDTTSANKYVSPAMLSYVFTLANGFKRNADGTYTIDFSQLPSTILEAFIISIIDPNGGIGYDSITKKLVVDFTKMPTDKFEEMLKSIKVPIWLNNNTTWYVRKTGSDAAGRDGRSVGQAFLTIDRAIKEVTENFNLNNWSAIINIGEGTYDEIVYLRKYQSSSGKIFIIGAGATLTKIRTVNIHGIVADTSSGVYIIRNLGVEVNCDHDLPGSWCAGIYVGTGSYVQISNVHIQGNYITSYNKCVFNGVVVESGMIYIGYGVKIGVDRGTATHLNSQGLTTSSGGIIYYDVNKTDIGIPVTKDDHLVFKGNFTVIIICTVGSKFVRYQYDYNEYRKAALVYGENIPQTCQKFYVGIGSVIEQVGSIDYFPGGVAGVVETVSAVYN